MLETERSQFRMQVHMWLGLVKISRKQAKAGPSVLGVYWGHATWRCVLGETLSSTSSVSTMKALSPFRNLGIGTAL